MNFITKRKPAFTRHLTRRLFSINADKGSEFTVANPHGFLPRRDPLAVLPSYFDKLEELLHEMPISKPDGTYGLLHSGRFGEQVERELPLYDVGFIHDHRILSALFRDYTFLASAYILEPCDIQYRLARNYGLGRRVLPQNIAEPLEIIAGRLGASPFLEHSMSFTFYNYQRRDPSQPLALDNMEPIRRFSGCETEHAYVVGHVNAAQHTGGLVEGAVEILRCARGNGREGFDRAMKQYTEALKKVNQVLGKTLKNTSEYASFRTYLSGCKHQPMFNQGVFYENSHQGPREYFGVSQSSNPIASLNTHLFQLSQLSPQGTLPCTNGVDRLRPLNYQRFLTHINQESRQAGVQQYALKHHTSTLRYMEALDQVLQYRYRQWANLRDSIPVLTTRRSADFHRAFAVQTRHIRDIAELLQRTHQICDLEMLEPKEHVVAEQIAHRAEMARRSLSRLIDQNTSPEENRLTAIQ